MATSIFKSLTDTTFDSVEGYRKAAEKAESPQLKQALNRRLEQRKQTLDKMNGHLQSIGDDLVTDGTVTGAAHRVWADISGLFEGGDEAAAERVEEGEDYISGKFKDALEDDDLDSSERQVVQQCYSEICEGERFADMLERKHD